MYLSIFIFCAICLVCIYLGYTQNENRYYERRQQVEEYEDAEIIPQQNNVNITPNGYSLLVNLITVTSELISDVQELVILAHKNAEVASSLLDPQSEYVSYDFIEIWYKDKLTRAKANFRFLTDYYAICRIGLPVNSRFTFDAEIAELEKRLNSFT